MQQRAESKRGAAGGCAWTTPQNVRLLVQFWKDDSHRSIPCVLFGGQARLSSMLKTFLRKYERERRAQRVSFREMLKDVAYGDRLTHFLHPYAAKLLPHIPILFLRDDHLTQPGDSILDPFCGSGTVPLEAMLAKRNAMYCDANPLARLVTKVKTTPICPSRLNTAIASVRRAIPKKPRRDPPDVVNLTYWYLPHVIEGLQRLSHALANVESEDERDFLRVCFSVCARKASLSDPRLSVPVRLRADQYPIGHP